MQSSGKESDRGRVQQGKDDFCQETYEMPIVSWKYSHELEAGEGGVQSACAGGRPPRANAVVREEE